MSLFPYAGQNPINNIDPSGEQAGVIGGGLAACLLNPELCAAIVGPPIVVIHHIWNQCTGNIFYSDTTDTATPPDDDGCKKEWQDARSYCSDLLAMPPSQRPPGLWGGSYDKCVLGQVAQRCGGNRVE
jgi:hypothetical protein